jgi:8-hydroxy-5-deazaflavin:NADPH oxidoreductase
MRALPDLPADAFAGKVVMDTNNYYPQRDGNIAELDDGSTTGPELLQAHLGTAQVVKVFNNIYFKYLAELARPAGAPDRSALPIAGDGAGAKAAVTGFLDAIGFDAVDAGPLGEGGRRFQVDTPAYGRPYGVPGEDVATRADADAIRAVLAAT